MRFLLALTLAAATLAGSSPAATAQPQTPDPIVIGHRGVHLPHIPENTLTAFRAAVAGGAVMLETDVQWTRDGNMVLLHDGTLNRTTNCHGTVKAKTYRQVRRCHTTDGQPLTSFAELLDYAHSAGVQVDAEVKLAGMTRTQGRSYVAVIAAHGMTGRVIATSFYTSNLTRLASSGIERGVIDFDRPHTAQQAAQRGQIVAANLTHTDATRVAQAHTGGLKVYVWTLHTDAEYAQAKAMGVDGIITDDPAGLTAWLTNN